MKNKTTSIFTPKFFSMKIYRHVENIAFVSAHEVTFTLSNTTAHIRARLNYLRHEFPELYDVECSSKFGLYTMTFPTNISEEKVKAWFYYILGDEYTAKEFAAKCPGDLFQIAKTNEKEELPYTSVHIYKVIQNLSFVGHQVTFTTLPSEATYHINDRIDLLARCQPWMHFVDYHQKRVNDPAGSYQLHSMTFPDNISESHIKMYFYLIVGDKENYFKERQLLNQGLSEQLPMLEQLYAAKIPGSELFIDQLNNRKAGENNPQEQNITNTFEINNILSSSLPATFFAASGQETVKLNNQSFLENICAQPQQSDSLSDDELFKDPIFLEFCASDAESTDYDDERIKRRKFENDDDITNTNYRHSK